LRFSVDNNKVRRVAPLAVYAENFLDEWTLLSWDDARHWANESSEGSLKKWHAKLKSIDSSEMELLSHLFGE
jgi:hypothetical protein